MKNQNGDDDHDGSDWEPEKFPGVNVEAFKIVNRWAEELKNWEIRVRSMCAIMEYRMEIDSAQFARVIDKVRDGHHSKADIADALGEEYEAAQGAVGVIGATDVVGHPPDPPFAEPVI